MNPELEKAVRKIKEYDGPPLRIMEVCGTHTHEIFRLGIRNMLPGNIRLISGPGCPVCVTPVSYIDEARFLALEKGCTVCTFGDLIRVPGSGGSLADARARGGRIMPVYSPDDALEYAKENPGEEVVFLAVGFETTTPVSCFTLINAREGQTGNFSMLVSNKTMDMAYRALKGAADAFLYPGHVSVVTGTGIYRELVKEGISGVVTGFTGPEIITAITVIIEKSRKKESFFVNCYPRVVKDEANKTAERVMREVFEPCDAEWRGLGIIKGSGLALREEYSGFDARKKFNIPEMTGTGNKACRCGEVLKGEITPEECPLFGKVCTPEKPSGACMVSSEGACSAYYKYR